LGRHISIRKSPPAPLACLCGREKIAKEGVIPSFVKGGKEGFRVRCPHNYGLISDGIIFSEAQLYTGTYPRKCPMSSNRSLKNAHQSRASRDFPHPSPCQARGRLVAAWAVGNGLKPFPTKDCLPDRQVKSAAGAPVNGISRISTCIWAFLSNLGKDDSPGGLREARKEVSGFDCALYAIIMCQGEMRLDLRLRIVLNKFWKSALISTR